MELYIVRHTVYHNPQNVYPFHLPMYLSPEGREHAKRIGNYLKSKGAEKWEIFSSPIVRAVQTAEIIASQTDSIVIIDKRLTETSCPNLEGKVKQEPGAWETEVNDKTREKKDSIHKRMMEALDHKIKDNTNCIMVSHGVPITTLYFAITKQEIPENMWDNAEGSNTIQKGEIIQVSIENGIVINANRITV